MNKYLTSKKGGKKAKLVGRLYAYGKNLKGTRHRGFSI
jgi:hypothetical protein